MVLEEEKKKKKKNLKAKALHCEENSIFLKWNWFTDYLKAERSHLTHTVSLPYTHTHTHTHSQVLSSPTSRGSGHSPELY